MINFRINKDRKLGLVSGPERNSWIDVVEPGREELDLLEREYGINPEHLLDIMDLDEQARIEKEDEYTLLIVRLPFFDSQSEVPYFTLPCGILLFSDRIVTVCQRDCEVLEEMRSGKEKGIELANKSAFVLHLFGRAAIVYLRYLKEINRRTSTIEKDLQRSVKNNELTQLLAYEKCLVFFTTSLKSNEILLEKLQSARLIRIKEDEAELLEDVLTDNKQAIEMANIYSDILSGMMDAFASVISNNQNLQIKRLTTISIIFMPLNVIASMGGMSEYTAFTEPFVPWPVAYAFFSIGLCVVGLVTAGILKVSGLGGDRRVNRGRRQSVLAAPAAVGIVPRR